ncbi:MAG: spermidine synthase [Zoogloeaceae bacterium]|nr:spermidine synthase [Zoogloeaceae bacterium]
MDILRNDAARSCFWLGRRALPSAMSKDKMKHTVEVSETEHLRYLHFGSEWIQGAMRIARPWALEIAYTREMLLPLLLCAEPLRHCLVVGLGAASQLKFLYRHFPSARFRVLEINPDVPPVARRFFRLPDSPRIEVVITDAAAWMTANAPQACFDLILQDGFDAAGSSGALSGAAFYARCHAALAAGGAFSCNLLGYRRGFQANLRRIRRAFSGHSLHFPSSDNGNVVALGFLGAPPDCAPLAELHTRALSLKTRTGLDLHPVLSRLQLTVATSGGRLRI